MGFGHVNNGQLQVILEQIMTYTIYKINMTFTLKKAGK